VSPSCPHPPSDFFRSLLPPPSPYPFMSSSLAFFECAARPRPRPRPRPSTPPLRYPSYPFHSPPLSSPPFPPLGHTLAHSHVLCNYMNTRPSVTPQASKTTVSAHIHATINARIHAASPRLTYRPAPVAFTFTYLPSAGSERPSPPLKLLLLRVRGACARANGPSSSQGYTTVFHPFLFFQLVDGSSVATRTRYLRMCRLHAVSFRFLVFSVTTTERRFPTPHLWDCLLPFRISNSLESSRYLLYRRITGRGARR
jgi:hypothetical protein